MWPIIVAFIIHFVFRTTVFFEPATQPCSAAPSLSSVLVLLSTLMILSDTKLFPDRYAGLPQWFQFATKLFISVLLVEFAMIFVWCRLERVVQKFFKCVLMDGDLNMYADMGGDALPAAVIMLVSIVLFWYWGGATNCFATVKAITATVIVNVMIFVRSITAKFHDQVLVTFMQRRGEAEPNVDPVCPPPACQPVCPTNIVCNILPPPPVSCCSTAVQEIPCRDDNRCPVQCMPPPVACSSAANQDTFCRDDPCQDEPCRNDNRRRTKVKSENISRRTRSRNPK
jgi:Domain of unknown function (DUF4818)